MIGLLLAALLASAPGRCVYEAQLEWPLSRDEDAAAYVVERSDDGMRTWRAFLRVPQGPGRWFSKERRRYEVRDGSALSGSRYRMHVVDEVGNTGRAVELKPSERTQKRCTR